MKSVQSSDVYDLTKSGNGKGFYQVGIGKLVCLEVESIVSHMPAVQKSGGSDSYLYNAHGYTSVYSRVNAQFHYSYLDHTVTSNNCICAYVS